MSTARIPASDPPRRTAADTGRPSVRIDSDLEGPSPRVQVAGIQRRRLLTAAVSVIDEVGYANASVGSITSRARVSRRTFYELFENREDCLSAVLEDALERVRHEMAGAGIDGLCWRERLRAGLWTILSFLENEPVLARVCIVQASRGSERMLERRADVFALLARVIDEGRNECARGQDVPSLTAEGLVGAAHAIVYERVLKRSDEPLPGLFTALMSMIVLPYLGPAAARRERTGPTPPPVRQMKAPATETLPAETGPQRGLPLRLTYRTVRVLQTIAENPGTSNRTVGDKAGVPDQGQISKLLARLERIELIANQGEGHAKGEANAWRLTPTGIRLTQNIQLHTSDHKQAA